MNKKDKEFIRSIYDERMDNIIPSENNLDKTKKVLTFTKKTQKVNGYKKSFVFTFCTLIVCIFIGILSGVVIHIQLNELFNKSTTVDTPYGKKSEEILFLKENGLCDRYIAYSSKFLIKDILTLNIADSEEFSVILDEQNINSDSGDYFNMHCVVIDNVDYFIIIKATLKLSQENLEKIIKVKSSLSYKFNDIVEAFNDYFNDTLEDYRLEKENKGITLNISTSNDFFFTIVYEGCTYISKYIDNEFKIIG